MFVMYENEHAIPNSFPIITDIVEYLPKMEENPYQFFPMENVSWIQRSQLWQEEKHIELFNVDSAPSMKILETF